LNYGFTKRLNDFLFGTQDAIAKGKVDGRVDKTRRASSETEVKKRTRKECDKSYDKQCKGKEIKVKTAPKKYEKGNDEDRRSKYCTCGKECVKSLDELRRDGKK
jgi:hypothetical protein